MKTDFFDHIYLVNLRQHRGRRLKALAHLKTFGITPTLFEASDGYMPPLLTKYNTYSRQEVGRLSYFKKFNELEFNRKTHFIESAGAFGYIDTYIRILKDAKLKGYQSILIFEDDVLLSLDFNEQLKSFCSTLPETWKFINLGASQYNWDSVNIEKACLQGFYRPKQLDTCGSFAIAIRSTIFDELIQLQSHFEAPFDHIPLGEIYNKYASDCFVIYPNIVMPDVRSSSIRGSRNQLVHAQKMKWNPGLFEYPLKRLIINVILTSKEQIKYVDAFNDESTFPFELHLFIQSLDGLRPYHDASQPIEVTNEKEFIASPNSGYCVRYKNNAPFTEDELISLYESLIFNKQPTTGFEIIDTMTHRIDSNRVSVIIPTYKRSENIGSVVLSVIDQDYENKEIIVVDDNPKGSGEQLKTENIILRLIEEYPDTNLIYLSHSKNRNGAGARNTGFMKSTGNYICFLDDDDDLYLPGRLSLSIKKLRETPGFIGGVYCGFIGWNGAIRTKERYKAGNLTQELLSLDYLAHYLHTNTVTYKRDAVITINGFDETFRRHQDIEFNLRFFENYDVSVVPEQLISLKPEPTKINNQQYGIDLFETKLKFLKKFQYIINRFDQRTQKAIYDKHWEEVIKHVSNEKLFEKHLLSEFKNGYLQCFSQLSRKDIKRALKTPNVKNDESFVKTKEEAPTAYAAKRGLNFWQAKGVNFFGLVFSKFILPHHKLKLENNPEAFFEDSKNSFTRLIGKLLRII